MGRHLYSLLLLLCTPLLIAHVVRKYRRENQDPMVSRRLGAHVPDQMDGCVWIHACSLGEAKVGVELARSLINHDASLRILMTATTPAGLDVLARSDTVGQHRRERHGSLAPVRLGGTRGLLHDRAVDPLQRSLVHRVELSHEPGGVGHHVVSVPTRVKHRDRY